MPLFVAATPIGNLSDLGPRTRAALGAASLILCEDTRETRRLLSAIGVPAPRLRACHAHNEEDALPEVLERLGAGEDVLLVSDAGTPAVSDPGARIVDAVHAAGHPVRCLPGPSAITAALSVSGLAVAPIHLLGFPPRGDGDLDRLLTEASRWPGTLVLLERGSRLGRLLAAVQARLPDRRACICRELSKLHEEVRQGPVLGLPAEPVLGEVVLVIGPGAAAPAEAAPSLSGEGLKDIAAVLAARWGVSRRDADQRLLAVDAAARGEP